MPWLAIEIMRKQVCSMWLIRATHPSRMGHLSQYPSEKQVADEERLEETRDTNRNGWKRGRKSINNNTKEGESEEERGGGKRITNRNDLFKSETAGN